METNFSHISSAHISKSKRYVNVKSSKYYFQMKTKILADFQIYISVPLISTKQKQEPVCLTQVPAYLNRPSPILNKRLPVFVYQIIICLNRQAPARKSYPLIKTGEPLFLDIIIVNSVLISGVYFFDFFLWFSSVS